MIVKQAALMMALALLTGPGRLASAPADVASTNRAPVQEPDSNTISADSTSTSRRQPETLPVVTRIGSLTPQLAQSRTNLLVRIQGVVRDQALGEYVIIQDGSGSIRAETRQTTPLGGGESVSAWGKLAREGNEMVLRDASIRPLAWDSLTEQRIVPAPGKPSLLAILTQVRQIRELSPSQAAWKYPVRVRGLVTTIWSHNRSLFLQDHTAGIYVSASQLEWNTNWTVGDELEIDGATAPGSYAPIIEAAAVRILGRDKLPPARLVTLYQMASGQFDAQWVEVRGVARSARITPRFTELQLSDVNGLVQVQVPGGDDCTNLVDSLVRIRGVCASRANPNRQLITAYVWSPSPRWVVVEEKGVADPFTLPTQPIASLSQFNQAPANQHRVKIAGVVTFSQPGRPLFVQDESGGMPVYPGQATAFRPGDRVDVAGYLSPGDFGYVIRNASCRFAGRGTMPAPKPVPALNLLDQNLAGLWVQLNARLVSSSRRADDDVLTLQASNLIFEALRSTASETAGDSVPPAGSLLRLRGVYSIIGDEARQPRALRLYIPASEPIAVLERPSWWTGRHASTLLGTTVVVMLAAALWAITLRRRVAEQTSALRERLAEEARLEQRYREIFEGANDLIFTFDLGGQLTSLNPAGQRLLGYSAEEVKQLKIDQILAPTCRALARQLLETKAAASTTKTCECELITRNGIALQMEVSARLMLKRGKVHSVQAIARDISERKRAEGALRESEAHYRQLVELSPNAIFIQHEGRITFINPAGLQLFGAAKPEELLGKRVLEITHPAYRDIVAKRIATVRDEKVPVALLEEKYLRVDGSVIDVEVAAAPVLFENKPAAQVIVHDITKRKQAEAELFNSRQMLRLVLDTIPQRVFWKDRNLVYVGCNKALVQDSGYTDPSQIIGKTDYEMGWVSNADQYRADDREVMETDRPKLNYEEPQTRPDGTQTWLRTSKVPLHDRDGRVIGVLGTYEDITERKQAQDALAEASGLLQTLLDNSPDCIYFKDRQSRFVHCSKAFQKLFNVTNTESLLGKTDFDFFTEEHARPAFEDEQAIIRSGTPIVGKLEKETHEDGRLGWCLTTKMPWRDKDGNIIGTFGISKDVTEIKQAEADLAYERELFRELLDNFPDSIYFKDLESRFVRVSRSKAEMTFDLVRNRFLADTSADGSRELPPHLTSVEAFGKWLIGKTDFDTFDKKFATTAFEEERKIIQTGEPVISKIESAAYPGKWTLVTKMPWRDRDGKVIGTFGVSRDITPLKKAEGDLEAAHQRLLESSRMAGMAEVATDVLHNVGNVLNSVNVSCSLTLDCVKASKVSSLAKVSALLQENRGRLADFLTADSRGRQIPDFVAALTDHLRDEQSLLTRELEQLVKHIDHIKQIVAMQQTYARVVGVMEAVNPVQLVEDALHINAAALHRHDVEVQRDYAEVPQIMTEKHKVLQILVNLIRNAKYAMDDGKKPNKVMKVKVTVDEEKRIRIQVIDNGVGIPKENLTRIFSHGFTTRRSGHGFGLHSSALAVRELGGSLQASSDGPGLGATFTLLLPEAPPKRAQEPV